MTDTVAEAVPFDLLATWLAEAERAEPKDPNAMTLATADAEGRPSARIVLLKGMDGADHGARRGVVFYTNLQSRKAWDLRANPRAALLLHWKTLRRQVRMEGAVSLVSDAEADAYFVTRPRISRLGAWASDQSRPLDARATLSARVAEAEARFPDETVPRPPHWGGYRLVPDGFEFWQDMPYRLHERTVFARDDAGWRTGKLYP